MWYLKNGAGLLTYGAHQRRLFEFLEVARAFKGKIPDDFSRLSVHDIQEVVRGVRVLANQAPSFLTNVPVGHYAELYGQDTLEAHRFYNIGAGHVWTHPAWTPVDMFPGDQPHALKVNLWDRIPWPIESGTAKLVYSSHCIEHLDDSAIEFLFSEVMRIAEPGAIFRITAPNVDLFYREYKRDNRYFYDNISGWGFPRPEISLAQIFLSTFAFPASCLSTDTPEWHVTDDELSQLFQSLTYEQALDHITQRYSVARGTIHDHINWINPAKLIRMLQNAGFIEVEASSFGQSRAVVMQDTNFFDNTSPEQSLYVEAVRP